ncbi:hypothetical protein [Actinomadura rupiterrae]|uniref:hypothetical protein n=1 Tax=Actinomadura rupiterrae TaxID=559627 RepID=UPI0020A419AB|nr:hypothetical protein [Actinomadura rupiterrae]MCP2340591.1 hypothetical protein [Actinomadura rupiterrae]
MEKWKLSYWDGSTDAMLGMDTRPDPSIVVELPTDGLARTGEDEQKILELMREAVREHVGEHAILTDAEIIGA